MESSQGKGLLAALSVAAVLLLPLAASGVAGDESVPSASGEPEFPLQAGYDEETGFFISDKDKERFRLIFSGHLLNPNLTCYMQIGDGNTDNARGVKDLLSLGVGRFKPYFLRQEPTSLLSLASRTSVFSGSPRVSTRKAISRKKKNG